MKTNKLSYIVMMFFALSMVQAQQTVNVVIDALGNPTVDQSKITMIDDLTVVFKFDKDPGYAFKYDHKGTTVTLTTPVSTTPTSKTFKIKKDDLPNRASLAASDDVVFKVTSAGSSKTTSVIPIGYATGNLFEDAIRLRDHPDDRQLVLDILSTYMKKQVSAQQLILDSQQPDFNPYLKDVLKNGVTNTTGMIDLTGAGFTILGVAPPTGRINTDAFSNGGLGAKSVGLGAMDVTKIANVLSDILIDHAKQELTIAFFNRFKKFVDEHEEFRILFPKTTTNLSNLLSYKYPEMLPTLRAGFLEDISAVTLRLDDVLLLPKYAAFLQHFPELNLAIATLRLYRDLEVKKITASDLLLKLAQMNEWNNGLMSPAMQNFKNAVILAATFSESLREIDQTKGQWVSTDKLQEHFLKEDFVKIYLGLVYEQCRVQDIKFTVKGTTRQFCTLMRERSSSIIIFRNKAEEFVNLSEKVSNVIKEQKEKTKLTPKDISAYIDVSVEMIDYALSFNKTLDQDVIDSNFTPMIASLNEIYKEIHAKNYNSAISHTFEFFEALQTSLNGKNHGITFTPPVAKKLSPAQEKSLKIMLEGNKWYNNVNKKDIANITAYNKTVNSKELEKLIAVYTKDKHATEFLDFIQKAKPYALFMANMVEAKTESDIKAALESVILPVGSSTIKKYSQWNFAVQAYLGVRYGTETNGNTIQSAWTNDFGVSAPIGLAISHGLGKVGSLTAFIPLLDLGAIVDYKLNDTGETDSEGNPVQEKEYKIELGQIFSPGFYLVYGLPWNIPVSLGFGGQYGPGLSEIKSDNTTVVDNPYWKWNAFLSVDIPLFNFYNKPKFK